MNLRPIVTFGISAGLGIAAALSPVCQMDARSAIVAAAVSGLFVLISEHIRLSSPPDMSKQGRELLRDYSIILAIGLGALATFAILKMAKYDTELSKTLVVAFAAYIGKLTIDVAYLSPS